jgi:uncharacterized protein YhjY with autotransporter beta-barrel domain
MSTAFARSSIVPFSLARRLMAWAAAMLAAMILFAGPAAAQTVTASSVTPTTYSGPGVTLTFSFTVNSGTRQVTSASATSAIGVAYTCAVPADAGTNTNITFTCSGTYVTTAADNVQVLENATININSAGTPLGLGNNVLIANFVAPSPPTVTAVSPTTGIEAGGTSVTITGTNFAGTTAVSFGAAPATSFTVNSATSITATSPAGTGTVNVRVTNGGGTSAAGAANQFTYVTASVAPAITTNPSNATVTAGNTATFTAAASGTPTPTVQWQVSTDAGATFSNIAGATSTTLSFATTAADTGKRYRAVFTNSAGSATTTAATLTIQTLPVITTQPVGGTALPGAAIPLSAAATGTPTPTVAWFLSENGGATWLQISTSLSFSIISPTARTILVKAEFTNTAGTTTSNIVTLTWAKQTQTISFTSAAPAAATVGGPAYAVSATATSGLAVSFAIDPSASSVCSIAGGSVSFQGVGTCVINANQAGNGTYEPAPQVQQSFAVGQGNNVITFPALTDTPFTSAPPVPAATASSGLAISYASTTTGVCTATTGGAITFVSTGTCTISASQAGDANYTAASPVSQSFAITPGVNTITFAPLPNRALGSGSFILAATASSGLTVGFASTTTSVCTVSGTTVTLVAVGTCTITATQPGNGTFAAATPVNQSFTVTKAAATVALTSSASTVFFGQPVTLTATVSGVAPTGTVTFNDGATALGTVALTGNTASFTTTTLSAGSHSFTATYNGDASNDPGTSAAVSVTVNARPDPSADPDVRSSTDQQFRQTQRFVRSQIDNIGGRLDQLHSEGDNRGGMAVRISQVRPQLASALPFGGVAAPAPNETDAMAGAAIGGSNAAQPVGTVGAGAAAVSAAGIPQDEAPRWSIWASGDVSFGKQQPSGQVETRFTSQGLTVGMDGRFSDNLKLGAAFGFGWDNSRIGINGSENDASNASLAFYGSWRAAPQFYIDGIVGLGYGTINTTRYSTTGGVFLDGKRRTSQTFAALIATWEGRIGSIEFAPYLRADGIWVHLSPYSETGSTTWALAFQAADENSFSAVAGARLRFPLGGGWKLIGKGEYRTRLAGDYTQLLGYADLQGIQGSPYAITGTGADDSSFTGGLGIEGRLRQATIRLNYDLTTMSGGNIANRFSGALIVPF